MRPCELTPCTYPMVSIITSVAGTIGYPAGSDVRAGERRLAGSTILVRAEDCNQSLHGACFAT